MSVIWKKVWRDIWHHKARTAQVVLSIAVGVMAVGLTMGLKDAFQVNMSRLWQAATPAHIQLFGVGPEQGGIDVETVQALGRLPGIEGADGVSLLAMRWKLNPEDEWLDAAVRARDYENQKYDTMELLEGSWPVRGGVTVDRGGARLKGVKLHDTVYFEVNDRPRAMEVVGLTYDVWVEPPNFSDEVTFYVTRREMEKLGGPSGFNWVKARVQDYDEERAKAAGVAMTERLEELGIGHGTPEVYGPQRHFAQGTVDGISTLLVLMALLTMGMSLFLVINTMTAIVAEQVPQIGVMKATGAVSWQIFRVYLSGVMVYVLLALLIAVPLGVLGAHYMAVWILALLNMEVTGFTVSWNAVGLQVVLGLVAPLLAALWPVWAGARITVREAISTYGLGNATGAIDRLLGRLRRVPPLVALTVSNTFRRKGRLIMTQAALVGGGAAFMMVLTVQTSIVNTFDVFLDTYNFDVWIDFEQPQRIETLEAQVEAFPGVTYAEAFQLTDLGVRRVDDEDGIDKEPITLVGISRETLAYNPVLTDGRWLLPEDEHAIVLNQDVAAELGVAVGDDIVTELGDKETTWTVVGLLFDIMNDQTGSAVWLDTLSREFGATGRANTLLVQSAQEDTALHSALAQDLRAWFEADGKEVRRTWTASGYKAQEVSSEMVIVYLLGIVAVLVAIVGSVALSGTLGINAMERRREIGVMRAIGASGRAIGGLFVGEGLIIGLMSWTLAVPFSLPLGWFMTKAIGSAIGLQLVYRFSPTGVMVWFVVVAVLAVLASGLPAWRATRVRVREVLAYE